ncbi:hypothetical protein N7326_06835 [Corynebacterium sp. ES2794-CONJ1]|uniref:hypothetical protein n=1 Tax=unclassified Corynebacterium TaxID=2624378 RepID=UPI00216810B4|nr:MULTISPECIES: hypothetical protein [unclassified Corynebacterium]MCS4490107.1 hypothetical protein [Corynebacterium sp. ES2775-CONJ]MCS4492084.1 hypothetical protein [Corynebacterium sp. ES2715-CONJ3]MCS4532192.1 hypothetical protein [Corynebacterium sp. ES2730-CONJ]MCU9519588.1 hypothetical protein [Corynebacterium sp. ES2794-CONJ1]
MRSIKSPLRRVLGAEDGSTTIETAIGIASLMTVLGVAVGAILSAASYLSAIDIAGAAARSYVIGVDYQPARGHVHITTSGTLATATAEVPSLFGTMRAQAIFALEGSSYE